MELGILVSLETVRVVSGKVDSAAPCSHEEFSRHQVLSCSIPVIFAKTKEKNAVSVQQSRSNVDHNVARARDEREPVVWGGTNWLQLSLAGPSGSTYREHTY